MVASSNQKINGNFINKGTLRIKNAVTLYVSGDFNNDSIGIVESIGANNVIKIDGNLVHNGSNDLSFTNVNVLLSGSTDASISGTSAIDFEQLEVSKSASSNVVTLY
jgi:hypothetical protein